MPIKKYRIWVERRIEHCVEISGNDLTPEQARDLVYDAQKRGTGCSKHSKTEKLNCHSFIELGDTDLWEKNQWIST